MIELKRRMLSQKTVYGFVCPEKGLVRTVQEVDGQYVDSPLPPLIQIPLKLAPLVTEYRPIVILDGGRGSAKSESVSQICSAKVKDYGYKLGCFREFQNEIADSVHSIITKHIQKIGWPDFTITDSKISHEDGGSVKYRGLARNTGGIKSMDDFDIFWIEEAQYMSWDSIELLEPTLRKEGSQIIYSMNRRNSADPIAQEHLVTHEKELQRHGFYMDDQIMIIRVHHTDNPWFPQVLETKRLANKARWTEAKYNNIWNGDFNDSVENAIITSEMFDAVVDAHIKLGFKPEGLKVTANDPADGGDAIGDCTKHGSVFTEIREIQKNKIEDGLEVSLHDAIEGYADAFLWDCDGMGVGARKQVADALSGKRIDWQMYKGSEGVTRPHEIYQGDDLPFVRNQAKTNKETFLNKRSQKSWELRDKFYNTWKAITDPEQKYRDPKDLISISSQGVENMPQLKSEVCRIPLSDSRPGIIQVMTKKQMWDKYKIPSPNMFDSMVMADSYEPDIKVNKPVYIPRAPSYG